MLLRKELIIKEGENNRLEIHATDAGLINNQVGRLSLFHTTHENEKWLREGTDYLRPDFYQLVINSVDGGHTSRYEINVTPPATITPLFPISDEVDRDKAEIS